MILESSDMTGEVAAEVGSSEIIETLSGSKGDITESNSEIVVKAANRPVQITPQARTNITKNPAGGKKTKKTGDDYIFITTQIVCSICGFSCDDYYKFESHILDPPENHRLPCVCCDRQFRLIGDLRLHAKKRHKISLFSEVEKKHAAENPGKTRYYCDFCDYQDAVLENIMSHKESKHVDWFVRCPMCPNKFPQATQLFYHFQKCHALVNNVDLYCQQCSYHFYCPVVYRTHMQKVHQKMADTFKCILCTSTFNYFDKFCFHVHKHGKYTVGRKPNCKLSAENGRPVTSVSTLQCHFCSKILSNDTITKHLSTKHPVNENCIVCDAVIPSSEMADHALKLHGVSVASTSSDKRKSTTEQQPKKNKPGKKNKKNNLGAIGPSENNKIECHSCFALVNSLLFDDHRQSHRDKGTKVYSTPHPAIKALPKEKQAFLECRICKLEVRGAFINTHMRLHRTEKTLSAGSNTKKAKPNYLRKGAYRESNYNIQSEGKFTQQRYVPDVKLGDRNIPKSFKEILEDEQRDLIARFEMNEKSRFDQEHLPRERSVREELLFEEPEREWSGNNRQILPRHSEMNDRSRFDPEHLPIERSVRKELLFEEPEREWPGNNRQILLGHGEKEFGDRERYRTHDLDREDDISLFDRSKFYERLERYQGLRDNKVEMRAFRSDMEENEQISDRYVTFSGRETYGRMPEPDSKQNKYDSDSFSLNERSENYYREANYEQSGYNDNDSASQDRFYQNIERTRGEHNDDYDVRSRINRSKELEYRSVSPMETYVRYRESSREKHDIEERYPYDSRRKRGEFEDESRERPLRGGPFVISTMDIKCTECSKPFDTIENMVKHMKVVHFSTTAMSPQPTTMPLANQFTQRASGITQNLRITPPQFSYNYGYQYPSNIFQQMSQQGIRHE